MGTARIVEVPAERLTPWLAGFAARHGAGRVTWVVGTVRLEAPDGAVAELIPPLPPVAESGDPLADLVRHVDRARRVGAILIRRRGYAVGDFSGTELRASKTGSAYVQGQTKAGGWSQQRYARRRDQQATKAYAEAADVVAQLLLPVAGELEWVVGGGDRSGVEAVLADDRLAPLRARLADRVWPTPDPRLRVLREFPTQFRAVTVRLNELA